MMFAPPVFPNALSNIDRMFGSDHPLPRHGVSIASIETTTPLRGLHSDGRGGTILG